MKQETILWITRFSKNKIMLTKRSIMGLLLLATATVMFAQADFKRYPEKAGKITFKWEGNMKGTTTLYWDNYGAKEYNRSEITTKIFGISTKSIDHTLTLEANTYSWTDGESQGMQMTNPYLDYYKENPDTDWKELGEATLDQMGYSKVGTEKILGRTCDVWEGIGKIWVWKMITLKSSVSAMGVSGIQTATEIQENPSIPKSIFTVPKNIDFIIEVDELETDEYNNDSNNEDVKYKATENTKTEEDVQIDSLIQSGTKLKGLLKKALKDELKKNNLLKKDD